MRRWLAMGWGAKHAVPQRGGLASTISSASIEDNARETNTHKKCWSREGAHAGLLVMVLKGRRINPQFFISHPATSRLLAADVQEPAPRSVVRVYTHDCGYYCRCCHSSSDQRAVSSSRLSLPTGTAYVARDVQRYPIRQIRTVSYRITRLDVAAGRVQCSLQAARDALRRERNERSREECLERCLNVTGTWSLSSFAYRLATFKDDIARGVDEPRADHGERSQAIPTDQKHALALSGAWKSTRRVRRRLEPSPVATVVFVQASTISGGIVLGAIVILDLSHCMCTWPRGAI